MHSDVLLAFLGVSAILWSLPTSCSSCSAPENGMGWKGWILYCLVLSLRELVSTRPALHGWNAGTWTEQCLKYISHLTHRTLCLGLCNANNHSSYCHPRGPGQAWACAFHDCLFESSQQLEKSGFLCILWARKFRLRQVRGICPRSYS